MDALVTGRLIRTDGGCLALESGAPEPSIVLFPFGTALAPDGRSADVPWYGTVREGDPVDGGGGYVGPGALADDTARAALRDECGSERVVAWQQ
ncbi:hypothetical protein [Microbacterium rhizophilus]|uniref:hypothetical protein n=1 Tax=Microbacterium rhizophilus TaxID=3138934 RepID=UPI0031EDECDD